MNEPMQTRSNAITGRSRSFHTEPAKTLTSVIDIVRNRGRLWAADELADLLAISRKHIYKLAKGGRIPCLRMGGAIRFDPEATAQWLEQRAISPQRS